MPSRKIPWTSQPQYPVGVDFSNPLTKDIDYFLYGGIDATKVGPSGLVRVGVCRYGVTQRGGTPYKVSADKADYTLISHHKYTSENGDWSGNTWGYFTTDADCQDVGIALGSFPAISVYAVNRCNFNGTTIVDVSITFPYEAILAITGTIGSTTAANVYKNGVLYKTVPKAGSGAFSVDSRKGFFTGATTSTGKEFAWSIKFHRILSAEEIRKITDNPWQLLIPQERKIFVSVASSGLNITTTLATADASGFTANVDRQLVIATSLGTATASGFTANVDRQLSVTATLATATASGFTANVDRQLSITTTLATATASGFTANISSDLNVTATLATATASAFSANVDRQLSITTTLATANASGFTANVDRQLFITTTLATATASGFDASIALGGGLNITATRAVATASGFVASVTISTPQGSGWETYVAPIRKKTVKQFKEEFNDLTYFELEEKEDEVKSEIRLVEQDIRLNEDLGLDNLIVKLKLALKIQKAKLQAIKSVKQEKIQEAQVQQIQHEAIPIEYTQDIDIIHEDENIDADLSYIAAILRMKYFN